MKTTFIFLAALPLIFVSCSTYKKVSHANFKDQSVAMNEIPRQEYVLKKGKLHYESTEGKVDVRDHFGHSRTRVDSHTMYFMDHIVIPAGASGRCIRNDRDVLVIDFGKGVVLPFLLDEKDNLPSSTFTIGQRKYHSVKEVPRSRLYFKPEKKDGSAQSE